MQKFRWDRTVYYSPRCKSECISYDKDIVCEMSKASHAIAQAIWILTVVSWLGKIFYIMHDPKRQIKIGLALL